MTMVTNCRLRCALPSVHMPGVSLEQELLDEAEVGFGVDADGVVVGGLDVEVRPFSRKRSCSRRSVRSRRLAGRVGKRLSAALR